MSDCYGIDFGTRNTAVNHKVARLTQDGQSTIPSAVAYDSLSSEIRFGADAMQLLRSEDPSARVRWSVATSFKTSLESAAPFVRTPSGSKTASEVLADYFGFLARLARQQGHPVLSSAVFSIPVGFSALSRRRLVEAAAAAGIEVRGIVSESTAAYLQIVGDAAVAPRVAVVDWGAGTLDVSVLEVAGSTVQGFEISERACRGSRVAGDHLDKLILEHFASAARLSGRVVPAVEQVQDECLRGLLSDCEQKKIALSDRDTRLSAVDVIFPSFLDGKLATFRLTAAELGKITASAREQVFGVLESSIAEAGMPLEMVDRIVFIGGCTGIHGFREDAGARYQQRAVFPDAPEWAVATGAHQFARRGAYESLQEFGCILDDGFFLPLSHARRFDGSTSDVLVAATTATHVASIVVGERRSSDTSVVGTLGVPLQGHVGEPVRIRTTLRRDLSVGIEAWSECCLHSEDVRSLDLVDTRFHFRMSP